jgi:hypothetical protein
MASNNGLGSHANLMAEEMRESTTRALRQNAARFHEAASKDFAAYAEKIEREKLQPIEEAIQKANQNFDKKLEALQQQVQTSMATRNNTTALYAKRKVKLQEEAKLIASKLEKIEGKLKESKDGIQDYEKLVKENKEAIQSMRMIEVGELVNNLSRVRAEIESQKATRAEELNKAKLSREQATEDAILNLRNIFQPWPSSTDSTARAMPSDAAKTPPKVNVASTDPSSSQQGSATMSPSPAPSTAPSGILSQDSSHFASGSSHTADPTGDSIDFVVVDGKFTMPECMAGVPVAMITEGDTYWLTSWRSLEDWPTAGFNRSLKTVKFFDEQQVHPNQLLGRKYIDERGLCVGDFPHTIRRILEVLRYAQVADPLLWLRRRLEYLVLEHEQNGRQLRLKKILTEFKTDPVFKIFRDKFMHKSIIRDSARITKAERK